MTLSEIKTAIGERKTVHWVNDGYEVIKDKLGQYFIICTFNNYCIGLTHADDATMNGRPDQFYIKGDKK